jgi:hypothetical protein
MALMTQNIGDIRAVSLLGWTRMCHTAPESRTAGPTWTYRRNEFRSRTCGTPPVREHQADGSTSDGRGQKKRDPWNELRGTEVLEAIMASFLAVAAVALFLAGVAVGVLVVVAREIRREDRLYSLAEEAPNLMSRGTRRLTGFGRRDLYMTVLTDGRRAAA